MGLFSSGKKHKRQAEAYLRQANAISDYQSEVEFRRQLLSNIRQERIARAQLEVGNYSTTARTSSQQGALANIDSSLAGETYYSYASSDRMQQIADLNNLAKEEYRKYQHQQKTRATAFAVGGLVLGAATGGVLGMAGMAGKLSVGSAALTGAQIGQGVGQIASNTGQTQIGIQNILGGIGTGIDISSANAYRNEMKEFYEKILSGGTNYSTTPTGYSRYLATSIINGKPDYSTSESFLIPQPNGTTVKACKGYFS